MFEGDNNFIYSILKESEEFLNAKINDLIKTPPVEFHDEKMRQLDDFLAKESNKDISNGEKHSELYENALQIDYLREKQRELTENLSFLGLFALDILKMIRTAKENYVAPLYSFLFCITIFAFDEILRVVHSSDSSNKLLSTMVVVIINSFVMWILMWWNYTRRTNLKVIEAQAALSKSDNMLVKWKMLIIKFLLFIVITIFAMSFFHEEVILCKVLFVIGCVTPIVFYGVKKLNASISNKRIQIVFPIIHSCVIIIYSIISVELLFAAISYNSDLSVVLSVYNNTYTKLAIFIFVLINGLVLPFTMPYFRYKSLLVYVESMTAKIKVDISNNTTKINEALTEFIK